MCSLAAGSMAALPYRLSELGEVAVPVTVPAAAALQCGTLISLAHTADVFPSSSLRHST